MTPSSVLSLNGNRDRQGRNFAVSFENLHKWNIYNGRMESLAVILRHILSVLLPRFPVSMTLVIRLTGWRIVQWMLSHSNDSRSCLCFMTQLVCVPDVHPCLNLNGKAFFKLNCTIVVMVAGYNISSGREAQSLVKVHTIESNGTAGKRRTSNWKTTILCFFANHACDTSEFT